MNYRMIFNTLGKVGVMLSVLLAIPMILSACLAESCWWAFAITIGISLVIGLVLMLCLKPKSNVFYSKEGLIIVSLSWVYVSLIGALPFVISRAIPSYIDALFEITSGFSTTGATILTGDQIESMAKGLLFWRSFSHFIGGMGVIVLVMAVLSGTSDRSMHILRAEMPGPTVDKIVPRAHSTAKILYLIYVGLTVAEIIALIIAGMPIFDSVVHAFGTAGTGGFGIKADSVASYNPACQWIITVFMLLFGVNFNVYFLLIVRKFRSAFASRELWIYAGIVIVATTAIAINITNQLPFTQSVSDGVRHSVFQVASFLTTTGYSTVPASSSINAFPLLSKGLLFILMFIGGCAGSTAGGLKISRVALLGCAVKKELRRVLNPRNANAVKFEGKIVSDETMHGVTNYFAVYMFVIAVTFVLLCFDPAEGLSAESNITAAVSCVNNIGPAYGVAASGYYMYSWFSKLVMTLAMLVGRLEIYPVLLAFTPMTWIKR
ncbi:MAG: TrkH family potassium uptake protein [Corallococcus sp.]|nr:TrkH family potassium uptake protein [Bacillota bacterium]MCM1533458.1 TrkH family potassium uptake protein [Corallococcus sp.]